MSQSSLDRDITVSLKIRTGGEEDLIVLHAKEFDFDDPEHEDIMIAKNPRNSIIRRVHWNRLGYPVLDMQEHQDIPEPLRKIQGKIVLF